MERKRKTAPPLVILLSLLLLPTSSTRDLNDLYGGGAQPRLVCTPIPPDADPACFPAADAARQSSAPPAGWWGASGEAKAATLHLRESLLRHKETILDQRETIRELTAKLALCEGFERASAPSDGADEAKPREKDVVEHVSSSEQMERMLQALKDRLENLQKRNSSLTYSSSLGELLQRKIDTLEEQLHPHDHQRQHPNDRSGDSNHTGYFEEHGDGSHRGDEGLDESHHGDDGGHDDLAGGGHHGNKLDNMLDQLHLAGSARKKEVGAFQLSFPVRTSYMHARIKRTLPRQIFALTLCLRIKAGAGPAMGTPFSYSAPGQANQVVLIEWGGNPVELLIDDQAVSLPVTLSDGKWHHVCVTWSTRDGHWEAYKDGDLQGSGEGLAPWHPVRAGGVFVLGQEQDTLGGRFDAAQSFVGELADVQMWSSVLSGADIQGLASCRNHLAGDVISWSDADVELHGGVLRRPFQTCH
ncbi:neuronal pentraxin-2 [Hippocampus zosterae]|uniref:neuronal pentraxin-2 n=1 Tax=Hippocampus zosterae TaxID=109293 RepID=UPI00223E51A4|nr:neuronal pentraxin-2 [Hippocampus zosterae]